MDRDGMCHATCIYNEVRKDVIDFVYVEASDEPSARRSTCRTSTRDSGTNVSFEKAHFKRIPQSRMK